MRTNQVLIVDDEAGYRNVLRLFLRGYIVLEAANSQQALDLLKKPNSIDLVILDVVMPGLSGTEALKKIKELAPAVKVIVLTGYSSKDIVIESLRNRADYYLEKMVTADELREIVDRLLKEKNEAAGRIMSGPDETIIRVARFIERNFNKKISLEDAAAEVCLSGKYLSRLFKERVGTSFREFKLAVMVKKAKEMLRQTSFSVKQISAELGYENPESFIRTFQRLAKKSPTKFRRFTPGWKKVNS